MRVDMCVFKTAFAVYIVHNIIFGVDGVCDSSQAKTSSSRLKQSIMCGYDRLSKPVKNSKKTAVNVTLDMRVMFINFAEELNAVDVHSWCRYSWKDEFLKWEKTNFENISILQIQPSLIWLPDLSIHNPSAVGSSYLNIGNRHCWLGASGTVYCVIPTKHSIECSADIKHWPFDTHNCTMRIGSWTSYSDQINISLFNNGISFNKNNGFIQVGDWTLLNASGSRHAYDFYNNKSSPYISYSFVLQRNSMAFAATVIVPSFVLSVVTLICFWLDCKSPERIGLLCLNILCHCLYLIYLEANLPHNGETPPVILLFFRDSLLLVTTSFIITFLVRRSESVTSTPPSWIVMIINALFYTPAGRQLLFLGCAHIKMAPTTKQSGDSEEAELMEASSKINQCRLFTVILDRLAFILFSVTYVGLLIAYLPYEESLARNSLLV